MDLYGRQRRFRRGLLRRSALAGMRAVRSARARLRDGGAAALL